MIQDWPHIRRHVLVWLLGMILVAAYFAAAELACNVGWQCGDAALAPLNVAGSLAIMLVCGRAALGLMRSNSLLVFTPLVAYAASSALFFGFGPMSTFLASDATRQFQAQSVFALSSGEALNTNLLSAIGVAVSLMAILLVLPRRQVTLRATREVSIRTVALLFVVSGLLLKHVVIMPSVYGTSNFYVPGVLLNLRYLPDLGFALMAMVAASGNRRWTLIFWLIWPWHLLMAFPEFSKKSVMLTMLLPAVGAYVGHQSLRRFSIWIVTMVLTFYMLQNTNAVVRWAADEATPYGQGLGVRERFGILANTIFSGADIDSYLPPAKVGVETWWLRLNYSGPQAAAMRLYDSGHPGSFTQNPAIYLIPRFIWPDKPAIASPGKEFHGTVTNNPDTSTRVGITVFADGYRQMGWPGSLLFAAIMGLILGGVARMSMGQLGRCRYLYLPAAMIGLQMGATSPTAFLQNAYIAALPVYFGFCAMVALAYALLHYIRLRNSVEMPAPSQPVLLSGTKL